MKKILFILLIAPILSPIYGQNNANTERNSTQKGNFFFYWGYNRSAYSKSDIRFKGKDYDFTMANASATDNYAKFGSVYFDLTRITIPQFNVRLGYYFKDNWALSFGQDHMKYIFADQNKVQLTGYVTPGSDPTGVFSGNYDHQDFVTDRNSFHYENSDGLNYLRFELTRSDQWYKTQNRLFALTTQLGISLGGILSFNDFDFAGTKNMRTISMSGYGLSAHLGVRLEFFERIFLQASSGNGFMHQLKVRTRPNDKKASASHTFFYSEFNGVIGVFFRINGKNDCNTCPKW